MMRFVQMILLASWLGVAAGDSAWALEQPQGKVILTVSGAIEQTNAGSEAHFDHAMLEKLGTAVLTMQTPWTVGEIAFEGVWARDVMNAVGGSGSIAVAVALNDYRAELPLEDFSERDVLLAFRMDGKTMRVRDKGPIWIVYPPDLNGSDHQVETRAKMVWQLKHLEIK